jgi:hypothetical protein
MKRFLTIGLMAAVLAVGGASKAQAAQITGQLDIAALARFVIGSTGAAATVGTATGFDFVTQPALTSPGAAGNFVVLNATGSFLAAGMVPFSTIGQMKDFTFNGVGSVDYPTLPLVGFQVIGAPAFNFTLNNIIALQQSNLGIILFGSGVMTLAGYDATPGVFAFSTQDPGGSGLFSFSATDIAVPEPGSMVLLGTGLLGLAAAARRMRKA